MQVFSTKYNSPESIEIYINESFVGFIRKQNNSWGFAPRKNKTFSNSYSSDVLRSIANFIDVKNKEE